jgi:predicted nicotinamide N-methyase
MPKSLWIRKYFEDNEFYLLNLDHPDVEISILSEMDSGIDVYYDQRWEVTEAFSRLLNDQKKWIENKKVLVLGAGVGMETIVIGQCCKKIYLNDLALRALDLCAQQLRKNGIHHFELIPGRYETIQIPQVDIVIGCYIIYNQETLRAMKSFLARFPHPVLLMNDPLPAFKKLLKKPPRTYRSLLDTDLLTCVLFP